MTTLEHAQAEASASRETFLLVQAQQATHPTPWGRDAVHRAWTVYVDHRLNVLMLSVQEIAEVARSLNARIGVLEARERRL